MKHMIAVSASLLVGFARIPQAAFAHRTYPEELFKGCNSYTVGIEALGAESVDNTVWVFSKEVDPYKADEKETAT
jgi:hypothetical protein